MIHKYMSVRTDVLDYIANRVELNTPVNVIKIEVFNKFPMFVSFFKCSSDMILEFIEWLVCDCYFYCKNNSEPAYDLKGDLTDSGSGSEKS